MTLDIIKSWIGHRVRELLVYLDWALQPKSKYKIAIFPWGDARQGSSNLRAIELGKSLKHLGWRVSVVPTQLELVQRQRILRFTNVSLLLLQMTRHPLNRPLLYPNIPIIFDIDDADYLDSSRYESIVECCKLSRAIIAGSSQVARWCQQFNTSTHVVWTGTPRSIVPKKQIANAEREPIVAWGCSMSMQYPAEAGFIKEILAKLSDRIKFDFWLYGVDSTQRADELFGFLREKGIGLRYFAYMPYQEFIDSLSNVAVGLNPLLPDQSPYSQGKSFGKVLAYLVANVAVVASDAVDHRAFFQHNKNGMIAGNNVDEWVNSIFFLLSDPVKSRSEITANAYKDLLLNLTTDVAANKVDIILRGLICLDGTPKPPESPSYFTAEGR